MSATVTGWPIRSAVTGPGVVSSWDEVSAFAVAHGYTDEAHLRRVLVREYSYAALGSRETPTTPRPDVMDRLLRCSPATALRGRFRGTRIGCAVRGGRGPRRTGGRAAHAPLAAKEAS